MDEWMNEMFKWIFLPGTVPNSKLKIILFGLFFLPIHHRTIWPDCCPLIKHWKTIDFFLNEQELMTLNALEEEVCIGNGWNRWYDGAMIRSKRYCQTILRSQCQIRPESVLGWLGLSGLPLNLSAVWRFVCVFIFSGLDLSTRTELL